MIQEAIDKLNGIPSQGTNEQDTDDNCPHFNDSIVNYSDHEPQEDAVEVEDQHPFQSADEVTE